MATRCASCSYPLSISDSVVCYECSSYFHINCAQLVGFPHYELSSDPNRNTFRCTTCELLPLPTRQCGSDSGSDCDMPSRQQDYAFEAQADFSKDMSEVKEAVQDLSNLCKDMLREINEIKSINLTLRCGIENLRHENEERDQTIADLKHRLDYLENSEKTVKSIVTDNVLEQSLDHGITLDVTKSKDKYIGKKQTAKEQTVSVTESTCRRPEEVAKSEVNSYFTTENRENRHDWTWKSRKAVALEDNEEEECTSEESNIEEEIAHGWETLQEELECEYEVKQEVVFTSNNENVETSNSYLNEEILHSEHVNKDEMHTKSVLHTEEKGYDNLEREDISDEETKPNIKTNDEVKQYLTKKEVDGSEEQSLEYTSAFQEECELKDRENTTTTFNKETKTETITQEQAYSTEPSLLNYLEDKFSLSEEEVNQDEAEEVNATESFTRIHKTADPLQSTLRDSYENEEEEDEEDIHRNESASIVEDIRQDDYIEVEVGEIPEEGDNEESILREEEKEDLESTEGREDGYRSELDLKEEVCESEDGLHPNEEEIREERPEEDERLEEPHLDVPDGETGVEDEPRLGGQSLEEGEVQPSEPPPTPPPQHTEEDLWHYLKEAVTSEHPSTVEEFLQNLIGTLHHVPEEYLQPVIEANIKRATSPTISTDGEPIRTLEDPKEKQEAVPLETVQVSEGDANPEPEETAAVEEVPPEALSQFSDEKTGDADGYSAVEAAA